MPNEEKRPQIKSRSRIKIFVEMEARPVEIEHARRAAGFAAGPFVFHAVTKIDSDAPAGFAQTQTEVDVGLALPIPVIEPTGGAKRLHVHQRATGVGRFDFYNSRARRRGRKTLKFFPPFQGLIPRGENPRRHERLLITRLLDALEIFLAEIYPGPFSILKFPVATGEIARLEENIGIDEQCVLRSHRATR